MERTDLLRALAGGQGDGCRLRASPDGEPGQPHLENRLRRAWTDVDDDRHGVEVEEG